MRRPKNMQIKVFNIKNQHGTNRPNWLSVPDNLNNRIVNDILVLCADGLCGIKEAMSAAFPMTEYHYS